jgi:hypothetical protein
MSRTVFLVLTALAACCNAALAGPVNIAVDIDSRRTLAGAFVPTVDTEPGFTSWDCTQTVSPLITVQGITFTLGGLPTSDQSRYRDGFFPGEVPGDPLLRDFVFNDSGAFFIELHIAGLDPGT